MRLAAALALLMLLPAGPTFAHDTDRTRTGRTFDFEEPARWGPRYETEAAILAIESRDGKITLLLTERVVAFQFSDRTMHKIERELRRESREHDDDEGPLGEAIKSAVLSGVRALLDHSVSCPLREVRDVRVEAGRLVFVTRDGDRMFERIQVDDEDLLESFDRQEAAAFAAEFRRLKARSR